MLKIITYGGHKMQKYEQRLVRCGYTKANAHSVCLEFLNNLSLNELEYFVTDLERRNVAGI